MSLCYTRLTGEAIERALDGWGTPQPGAGVVALLPEAEKDRLPLLQAACRARGLALAGGIFPALIRDESFPGEGAWLLPFAQMPPYRLIERELPGGAPLAERIVHAVGEGLASCPEACGKPTLFLVFDSMMPDIASLLDEVYLEVANRVEYSGINAGSESFQPMPCLFDAERLLGDAVLMLLLPENRSPVLAHGFKGPAKAMSATSARGNRIAMIDWRPAFEVYQEIVSREYGIALTPENFYEYGVHFPFGIQRAGGDVVVRIPVALANDGSLVCAGEIPENAVLVLLKAPALEDGCCVERLAADLRETRGFRADGPLLSFYCGGRRVHLGADAERELAQLRRATGAGHVAGAVSLGEIGSTVRHGYPMFHNAALVCAPWGEP